MALSGPKANNRLTNFRYLPPGKQAPVPGKTCYQKTVHTVRFPAVGRWYRL